MALETLLLTMMMTSPLVSSSVLSFICPASCRCSVAANRNLTVCQDTGLTSLPKIIDPHTNFLDLSANRLGRLENNTFINMNLQNLEIVDLKNCSINDVGKLAFAELRWLKELDLSDNAITTMDPLVFADNKMLQLVNMSGNPIVTLNNFQFSAMPRLTVLDFRNCHLKRIEREALSSLPKLETLNLQNNQLTTLPRNLFMWMIDLKSVALDANPWKCDCNLQLITVGLRMRGLYRNWSCVYEPDDVAVLWHDMNNVSKECVPQFGSYIKELVISAPNRLENKVVFNVMKVNRRIVRHSEQSQEMSWTWMVLIGIVGSFCVFCVARVIANVTRRRRRRCTKKCCDYNDEEVGLEGLRCNIYRDYNDEKPSTSYNIESFSLLDDLSSDGMSISMDL